MGAGRFNPIAPQRVLDTRSAGRKLTANEVLTLPLQGRGAVPGAGVAAVIVNITVTEPDAPGHLRAWSDGAVMPETSCANFVRDQTVAAFALVKVGADGAIRIANRCEAGTHLVVDVFGWWSPATASGPAPGAGYTPLAPVRVLNTRDGAKVRGGAAVRLALRGRFQVPATATAVLMNMTVTEGENRTHLTVVPDDAPQEARNTSVLNVYPGRDTANLLAVGLGAGGGVDVGIGGGACHVIADLLGYFDASVATGFVALPPMRAYDTERMGEPMGRSTVDLPLNRLTGVPAGAKAVVANVTTADSTKPSFVTTWPVTGPQRPLVSTLNVLPGLSVCNSTFLKLDEFGWASVYNNDGRTRLIVDVVGYLT